MVGFCLRSQHGSRAAAKQRKGEGMSHKTKAAINGRDCYYSEGSSAVQGILTFVCSSCMWRNHPKLFAAGGQRLSAPGITGTAPLARLRETTQKLGCLGCTAMQHTPEKSRSFDRYPDIGYHSLSASLAFLRWRRLISPLAAVTRNAAVLSPSSLRRSISSITSWGILIVVICDFAFFAPVAITVIPCVRCISVYAKKMRRKDLMCISLWSSFNSGGDIHLSNAKPGSARNTNRASNQTVNRGNSNGFH